MFEIKLFARSELFDIVRYFAYPIGSKKILITNNYQKFDVTDMRFNKLQSVEFEQEEIVSDDYFSDDGSQFLWNSEGNHLSYLNLNQKDLKAVRLLLPDNLSLLQYYVWDETKFIIVGLDTTDVNEILFFSYDINLNKLSGLSYSSVLKKYAFFEQLFECFMNNYLLYYDIKKEVLVYREQKNNVYEVFFQSHLDKKNIELSFAEKDVHRANYLDGFLVLIHENYMIFYYLGIEFFHINMKKKNWVFRSARLFKENNEVYCLVTQYDICQPKRNIIEIYKIEK